MVPRLVMFEKGYHEDEYTVMHVDPSGYTAERGTWSMAAVLPVMQGKVG